MKSISVGATRQASSLGLATSLAAVVGILARLPTLLVDLSTRPEQTRQTLGIDNSRGLEPLVGQLIRTRTLTSRDVREEITRYIAPRELGLGDEGFDFLAGPAESADSCFDKLAIRRGVIFVELLLDACRELAYETVIFDLGHAVYALRSEPLIAESDVFAWVQKEIVSDYYHRTPRHRQALLGECMQDRGRPLPPTSEDAVCEVVPETDLAFPSQHFVESLEKRDKEYQYAASRLALHFAEKMLPAVRTRLKDGQGKRLRPRRDAWKDLLG